MKICISSPENPNGVLVDASPEQVAEIQEREAAHAARIAEEAANQYKQDRVNGTVVVNEDGSVTRLTTGYPSLSDQLDMLYHDAVNGTTTWQEAVAAVKAAHPKPE